MSHPQLQEVLLPKGIISRKIIHDKDYSRYIYGFIESNCPSLLAFETPGAAHVIPVIGHTFNEDMWVPDADAYFDARKHYSSEKWLSSFLVHDDNFGSYLCLPRKYLDNRPTILYGLSNVKDALCFDKIELTALERLNQFVASAPLLKNANWYNRFAVFTRNQMLVLRPMFVDKVTYLGHLPKSDAAVLHQLEGELPESFWIVEVSFPELYAATRAKVGDVVLSCHNLNDDFSGDVVPLLLRLPGFLYFEKDREFKLFGGDYYCPLLKNY